MIKRRLNKKGFFLAEETMKILLAVICLLFLVFVLGKMYYSYSIGKEAQQAKDTLAAIEKEVNLVKSGEPREIVIYSPAPGKIEGIFNWWVLVGFNGAEKPTFCYEKGWNNCLCMCKNSYGWTNTQKEKCDDDKICVSLSDKKLVTQPIELLDLPMTLSISQDKDNVVSISKK
jgi:hypothetical protein